MKSDLFIWNQHSEVRHDVKNLALWGSLCWYWLKDSSTPQLRKPHSWNRLNGKSVDEWTHPKGETKCPELKCNMHSAVSSMVSVPQKKNNSYCSGHFFMSSLECNPSSWLIWNKLFLMVIHSFLYCWWKWPPSYCLVPYLFFISSQDVTDHSAQSISWSLMYQWRV